MEIFHGLAMGCRNHVAKRSQRRTIRQTLPDLQSKAGLIMAPADFLLTEALGRAIKVFSNDLLRGDAAQCRARFFV
jgi:hypothetical protein